MPRSTSVALANRGSIVDLHLLIHHVPREFGWDIRQIEIYADAGHTRLLADGLTVEDFDEVQLGAIYAALGAEAQTRRLLQLAVERMSCDAEPDDDYYERAAERADLEHQAFNQEMRDAGRGHLVRG